MALNPDIKKYIDDNTKIVFDTNRVYNLNNIKNMNIIESAPIINNIINSLSRNNIPSNLKIIDNTVGAEKIINFLGLIVNDTGREYWFLYPIVYEMLTVQAQAGQAQGEQNNKNANKITINNMIDKTRYNSTTIYKMFNKMVDNKMMEPIIEELSENCKNNIVEWEKKCNRFSNKMGSKNTIPCAKAQGTNIYKNCMTEKTCDVLIKCDAENKINKNSVIFEQKLKEIQQSLFAIYGYIRNICEESIKGAIKSVRDRIQLISNRNTSNETNETEKSYDNQLKMLREELKKLTQVGGGQQEDVIKIIRRLNKMPNKDLKKYVNKIGKKNIITFLKNYDNREIKMFMRKIN